MPDCQITTGSGKPEAYFTQMNGPSKALFCAGVVLAAISCMFALRPAAAQQRFPFGSELTLEAAPMRGSKRVPNIEIGDNGDVKIELWCKGAQGQFSVANDTVIFIPGAVDDRSCPPDRAQADDNLMAALGDVASWKMQGDYLMLIGSRTLRFHLNTN